MKIAIEPGALSMLNKVSDYLSGQKVKAYLVGGFIRDALGGALAARLHQP
jgi:tRNA nucleotidyltransferase/poly(A) polymerase